MAKGLPFLLLRNSAILKPKNQNEDIWNSNGDVPTVGNTNSCFATHFWGCRSKKWRLSLKNCGRAQCLYPFQLSSELNNNCVEEQMEKLACIYREPAPSQMQQQAEAAVVPCRVLK